MFYKPRIQADEEYLKALGRALYNFTYLEWIIVGLIVKLNNDSWEKITKAATAKVIGKAFIESINNPLKSISKKTRKELAIHTAFVKASKERNKLLHANPYTAMSGAQQ